MSLKVGALFAGYGGLELGLSQILDTQTQWVAEVETGPCKILTHRFPAAPNLGDVTKIDWTAVEPVDIITGGSPCQDLSHAGKRAGMKEGTRSGLWSSMCDAIETIRPQLVVWENVRGALSAPATTGQLEQCDFCMGDDRDNPMRALGRVLGDLAELGYDTAWCGLRAADVGAPHNRYRIFVLAWDTRTPTLPANLRHERSWTPRDRRARPKNSRDGAVALLPTPRATDGTKGGPNQRGSSGDLMLPSAVMLLPTPAVNDMGAGKTVEDWDAWTEKMKNAHSNGNGHGKSLSIETQRLAVEDRPLSRDFGQYAPAIARWESVLGRSAPAPTEQDWGRWEKTKRRRLSSHLPIGMRGSIRFLLDGPPRRLSPQFVEWLMGLPNGWVTDTDTSRNEQLKALGNGVVPQQAAAAVRHLLGVREWAIGM